MREERYSLSVYWDWLRLSRYWDWSSCRAREEQRGLMHSTDHPTIGWKKSLQYIAGFIVKCTKVISNGCTWWSSALTNSFSFLTSVQTLCKALCPCAKISRKLPTSCARSSFPSLRSFFRTIHASSLSSKTFLTVIQDISKINQAFLVNFKRPMCIKNISKPKQKWMWNVDTNYLQTRPNLYYMIRP